MDDPLIVPPHDTTTVTPIGDSLQRHLDDVLSKIPTGQRGTATIGVSTTGAVVDVGSRVGGHVIVGGFAGKVWGGSGWSAGARGSIVW